MEGANNGGKLYHEIQESKLCALHCINTLLQGPYFSEVELAAHASDLDYKERQMMMLPAHSSAGDFFSHNVALDGNFSIQVIQKALEVWDLQVIPLDSPVAEPAKIDPNLENAFIFHPHNHWFCVRKVNGEWYNFDSLNAAPQHLSKSCLAAYLDSLKGSGWSIFVVRGNFPKEFPISSAESSNGFGQWLSPEDAERITKSCNSVQQAPQERVVDRQQHSIQILSDEEDEIFSDMEYDDMFSDMEDEELKAAIAASLIDSAPAEANAPQNDENNQVASSLGGDKSQNDENNQNKENTP